MPRKRKKQAVTLAFSGCSIDNTGYSASDTGYSADNTGFSPDNTGFSPDNTGFIPDNIGFIPDNTDYSVDNIGYSPSNTVDRADNTACYSDPKTTTIIQRGDSGYSLHDECDSDIDNTDEWFENSNDDNVVGGNSVDNRRSERRSNMLRRVVQWKNLRATFIIMAILASISGVQARKKIDVYVAGFFPVSTTDH